jgi:hypothetical protein
VETCRSEGDAFNARQPGCKTKAQTKLPAPFSMINPACVRTGELELIGSRILQTEALERRFYVKLKDGLSRDSNDFRGAVNQSPSSFVVCAEGAVQALLASLDEERPKCTNVTGFWAGCYAPL